MPAVFKNVSVPDIQAALTVSATYVRVDEWGTYYTEAVTNWVADRIITDRQLAPLMNGGGGAFDATRKTVGSVTVERSAQVILQQMKDPYLRTPFGVRFKFLQRTAFGGTTMAAT